MTEQELQVRVLGAPGLAVRGGPPVELASAKAAALVYYLAVTGGAQPRSALAGLLWSDLPEATARANLRLVLTKLRRALPDHLAVTRQTVALTGPVRVDAAEVGRVASRDDDGADLLAAVRLCRGDLLPGFGVPGAPVFDEWLTGRRATVRADMLAVLDRAVRWAGEKRDAVAGVEVARRMLELDSLHEEAHRALMCFLAMGGRRSAALAQFETCRYLLADELGVEPAPATLALRDQIAAAGGGFTELAPVAAAHSDRIPAPLTTLVGRDRELGRLHDLLDDPACRLVTLVGPGGIGKTRLAVEIAAARRDRHRDGTVFASFVGADLIVTGLGQALGVPMAVPRDPLDLLADHLCGRAMLLVLDNLEQARDAPEVIAELLRRSPGTQILVTSRRRLGLGIEWLFDVPGLCHPEAVRLFQERVRLLRPGTPGPADLAGADRVCRLLAGMPLAIELAARWVRSATPGAIADRLAHGIELLETTAGDVDPRHRSIRSVIDSSCALLSDAEVRTLRRLSVLRGGFDLAACAAVADAGLPLLAALVEQSLVTAGENGRYAMHELLRQYAAELLAADPAEQAQTRRRHAEHYTAHEPAAEEADNLRAATDWLVRHGDPAVLDAHLLRIWALYRRMGWFRQAQAFFAAALGRTGSTPLQRARWHRLLGEAHQQLGEADAAREHLERALEVLGSKVPGLPGEVARRALAALPPAGRTGSEAARERAAASFTIVEVYWVLGEQALVLPAAIRSLTDAERAGDPELIVRAQAGLGMIAGTAGRRRVAGRHLRAATAGVEVTSDPLTACWVGIVGGLHWLGVGDWAAVDAAAARIQRLPEPAPLHRWADEALMVTAVAHYLTARYPEATAAATEGLISSRHRHDAVVQFWGLMILIETELHTGADEAVLTALSDEAAGLLPKVARIDAARLHVATARRHLAGDRPAEAWQAIRLADRLIGPRPSFEQYALEAHAGVPEVCLALLATDDRPEARATAAAGVRRLRRYARTFPIARPRALIVRGRQAQLHGHPAAAGRAWTRAVHAAERLRMPYELAQARDLLDGPDSRVVSGA